MPSKSGSLGGKIGGSLVDSLAAAIGDSLSSVLGRAVGESMMSAISEAVGQELKGSQGAALAQSTGRGINEELRARLASMIGNSLQTAITESQKNFGGPLGAQKWDGVMRDAKWEGPLGGQKGFRTPLGASKWGGELGNSKDFNGPLGERKWSDPIVHRGKDRNGPALEDLDGNTGWGDEWGPFGQAMAGFGMGQEIDGVVQTYDKYMTWLKGEQADPEFQKLYAKYGPAFQKFWWDAYRTKMDEATLLSSMDVEFGDWRSVVGGGGNGPSGGGASKAQQIEAAMAAIRNEAATLGLPIDDVTLRALATTVVNEDWSGDMLTDHLLKDPTKVTMPGTYTATADQVRAMAKLQLINISDATAQEWSQRLLSGEMSVDTVVSILQQQAAGEFGWAAEGLKTGATMADLLAPARDTIARELEMNPNDIDLMDQRWRSMVQTVNPSDNSARAATLTEVVKAARKDKAWADTSSAANMATSVATMVRRVMEG